MILIEPSAQVKAGDIVLYLSKDKKCIGKIFYHSNNILLQPLPQDLPPIMNTKAEKKRHGIDRLAGFIVNNYSAPLTSISEPRA